MFSQLIMIWLNFEPKFSTLKNFTEGPNRAKLKFNNNRTSRVFQFYRNMFTPNFFSYVAIVILKILKKRYDDLALM